MSNRVEEREAVCTTIVGGRPPGCGTKVGNIPRGIEILVKKASVDPDFKKLLLKIHSKSMKEQKKIMVETLEQWMADTSQVDDILVVGVRV